MKTKSAHHPLLVGLFLAAILGSWGCTHGPVPVKQAPLSPEVRNQLGTIGVVAKEESSKIFYPSPVSRGEAAGKGEKASVEFMCSDPNRPDPFVALIFCLLYGPVAAGIGAGVGTLMAPSAVAVQDAEAALHEATATLKIAEALREQVVQTARSQTPYSILLLPDAEPTAHGQAVTEEASESAGTPGLPNPAPSAQNSRPNYLSLVRDGVDTILEISASSVSLQKDHLAGEINPSLVLVVAIVSRLVRATDSTELYWDRSVYRGGSGTLTEWGADNARLLRHEVNRGVQTLAGQIVAQLFGNPPSP